MHDETPAGDGGTGAVAGGWAAGAGLADLTGKQIGRYLLGQRLGSGGVATVYRAYDQVVGQTVALKLLLPSADEKAYSRFRREAMTASALRHPNIVRILQIGVAPMGQVAYIAMELVEGQSLADLLNERGRLRPAESANLLEPIARALDYAHGQGVVHRDVKPGNILLRPAQLGAPNSVQLGVAGPSGHSPAVGFRHRPRGGCAGAHQRRADGRHAGLHGAGTVCGQPRGGRARRPLCVGRRPVPHHHRAAAVCWLDDADSARSCLRTVDHRRCRAAPTAARAGGDPAAQHGKTPQRALRDGGEMADALALAAGRLPPRPGLSPQDSTATLTLSALPVIVPPPEAPATTVLVPGVGSGGTQRRRALLPWPAVRRRIRCCGPRRPPTSSLWRRRPCTPCSTRRIEGAAGWSASTGPVLRWVPWRPWW